MTFSKSSRRRFLRGAGGLAVGIPFLESFASRQAFAAPNKRFGVFFCCNGVNMEKFFPTSYGAITPETLAGTSIEALGSHASKLLIPRGLFQVPRGFGRDASGGDDHAKGVGHKLTCAPNMMTAERYSSGASIDHLVAKAINPGGKGPLNLMVGGRSKDVLGSCSYSGPGQQAVPFVDPWKAFKDWMGQGAKPAGGPPAIDYEALRRKSVLDMVKPDFDALKANKVLSKADRDKLDLHFSAIRSVETGLGTAGLVACNLPDALTKEVMGVDPTKAGSDGVYARAGALMVEIMALAMACDYNRVVTLQWGSGAGGPVYSWLKNDLNKKYNHHKLSHGATFDAATAPDLPMDQWKGALFEIDQWLMSNYKLLLDRLAAYKEPGGSVLDNSAIMYVNDLGNGLQHNWMDLPTIIAGSAGGYLKQGQYTKLTAGTGTANDKDAPFNQFLTTLANAVGAKNKDGTPILNFGNAGPAGKPGEMSALKTGV